MYAQHKLELVCLGTGQGASHVYDGMCSTAYVLTLDERPMLLVGAGGGVVRQCLKHFSMLPEAIFIHNNRTHCAAELPVLLSVEASKKRRLRVIAESGVCLRLQTQRLGELHEMMRSRGQSLDDLCEFVPLSSLQLLEGTNKQSAAAHSNREVFNPATTTRLAPHIFLSVLLTPRSSELSAGLVVRIGESPEASHPLVAISGDSGFSKDFFMTLAQMSNVVVVDARRSGSAEHASFDEVLRFAESNTWGTQATIFMGSFGLQEEAPAARLPFVQPIFEGTAALLCPLPGVAVGEATTWLREAFDFLSSISSPQLGNSADAMRNSTTVVPVRTLSSRLSDSNSAQLSRERDAAADQFVAPRASRVTHHSAERVPAAALPIAVASHTKNVREDPYFVPQHVALRRASPPRHRTPPAHHTGHARFPTSNPAQHEPKKIFLFNNEAKTNRGILLMAQHFRTLEQLRLKSGQILGVSPVAELFVLPSGLPARSLNDIPHGASVVVTKHGGEEFSPLDLPLELRRQLTAGGAGGSTGRSMRSSAAAQPIESAAGGASEMMLPSASFV